MMCTTEKELRAAFEAEINKSASEMDIKKLDELASKLGSHPLTEDEKKRMQQIWDHLVVLIEQDEKRMAYPNTRQ